MDLSITTSEEAKKMAIGAATIAPELREQKAKSEEIMTTSQLAEYLKVTPATIRIKKKDELPVSYRVGDPRFLKTEIDAWMKGQI